MLFPRRTLSVSLTTSIITSMLHVRHGKNNSSITSVVNIQHTVSYHQRHCGICVVFNEVIWGWKGHYWLGLSVIWLCLLPDWHLESDHTVAAGNWRWWPTNLKHKPESALSPLPDLSPFFLPYSWDNIQQT